MDCPDVSVNDIPLDMVGAERYHERINMQHPTINVQLSRGTMAEIPLTLTLSPKGRGDIWRR
jgi:hypothetical protein